MAFRWFVSFVYRKCEDGSILFGSSVFSTDIEAFPFTQVAQSLVDTNNWHEVTILNWKKISEYEFLAASNFKKPNIRDVTC